MYIVESSECTGLSIDEELIAPDVYEFIIIDGGSLIHSLPCSAVQGKSFDGYFNKILYLLILHYWKWSIIIDIVWNQYRTMTIKRAIKENKEREFNNVYLVQQKFQETSITFWHTPTMRNNYSHSYQQRLCMCTFQKAIISTSLQVIKY